MLQVFKIAGYTVYFWVNSKIPDKQLRIIMQIIEARNKSVIDLWYSTFREIRFYC